MSSAIVLGDPVMPCSSAIYSRLATVRSTPVLTRCLGAFYGRHLDQCSVRRINRVLSRTSSDYPPIILGRRIGIPLIARSGTHESIGGSYDDGLDRSSPPASGIYGADDCSVRRKPHSVVAITCSHFRSASQKHVYNSPAVVDRCAKTNEMKRLFIRFLNAASYVYGLRFLRVGTTASTWTDQHPQSLTVAAR